MSKPCASPIQGLTLPPSALHVARHELLGVFLQNVVDLVEQLVELFLDPLTLLRQHRRAGRVLGFRRLRHPGLFLLLLSHGPFSSDSPPDAVTTSKAQAPCAWEHSGAVSLICSGSSP